MTEWLLLRVVREADGPWSWAVVDAAGQLLAAPSEAMGPSLQAAAAGRRVAMLLPGVDVALLTAVLPAGNEAKLLPLVPYALEDQVSQDIELLHFALGPRNPLTGSTSVAVIERALLDQWLARTYELGLKPNAAFADSELVPAFPGQVTVVLVEDQLVLRSDDARTAVMPAEDPLLALEMFLAPETDLSSVPLAVYAGQSDWQRHSKKIEALRDRFSTVKVQLSNGGLLALAARTSYPHSTAINLLQGSFRPKSAATNQWKKWRLVAALAGALLLVHGLAQAWHLRQLKKAEAALDQSISQVWATVFPGQPDGGNARRQMEQRLTGSAGSANQPGELMHVLAALAAARQNVPVVQLESLTFRKGAAQLKLGAPDASTLAQFGQALQAGGYTAQVTSGAAHGTTYEGQIEARSMAKVTRADLATKVRVPFAARPANPAPGWRRGVCHLAGAAVVCLCSARSVARRPCRAQAGGSCLDACRSAFGGFCGPGSGHAGNGRVTGRVDRPVGARVRPGQGARRQPAQWQRGAARAAEHGGLQPPGRVDLAIVRSTWRQGSFRIDHCRI